MPIRRRTSAASLIEGLIKRYDWRSIALVGVADHHVLSRLLGTATRCRVTVVARDLPTAGLRETGLWQRIKGLCRSYESRARLIEATPLLALDQIEDGEEFSAVFLAGCEAATLYDVGGAWLPRVKTGGMLIGDGARDLRVREILKVVAPSRQMLPDGMWTVRVRRADVVPGDEQPVVVDLDGASGVDLDDAIVADDVQDIDHAIAPDPVDAGTNEHETVAHVEAPELGTGAEGETFVAEDVAPPPKRRGRPKGSRTKKASVAAE